MGKAKKEPAPGRFGFTKVLSRWWWLSVTLIILVAWLASQTPSWLGMRGPLFSSTATVEVSDSSTTGSGHSATPAPVSYTFLSDQEDVIRSEETIKRALSDQNLLNRLGGNLQESIRDIGKDLTVRQEYGTSMLNISFRHLEPQLAHDVVDALLNAYQERRTEEVAEEQQKVIDRIAAEITKQEKKVQAMRAKVETIARELGIEWQGEEKHSELSQLKRESSLLSARIAALKSSTLPADVKMRTQLENSRRLIQSRIRELGKISSGEKQNQAEAIKPFNEARKEYQAAESVRDALDLKLYTEKAALKTLPPAVIVHEKPIVASSPSRRGAEFFGTILSLTSVPFTAIFSLLVMYLAEMIFPRRASS